MPNTKIQQFAQILADSGVDAFFAQTPVTMGYMSGFFEDQEKPGSSAPTSAESKPNASA